MPIRLSCNDYAWPSLRHQTVLAVIDDLGYEGVDIGVFAEATHVTVSSVLGGPEQRAEQVRIDVEAAGLDVADVFLTSSMQLERLTPTSRHGNDEAELRTIFQATVEFAAALGAPGITLLPGVVADGQSVAEAIGLAAAGLAPLVAMGAESGLGVSVEPHVGSCIESPEAAGRLLERCDGLTVTLDPSHFMYAGWTLPAMMPLPPNTRHVQIRPGGHGVMQCKVPDSEMDLKALIGGLVQCDYDGWLASEYVWMEKWRCDEVDNTAESARLGVLLRSLLSGVGR